MVAADTDAGGGADADARGPVDAADAADAAHHDHVAGWWPRRYPPRPSDSQYATDGADADALAGDTHADTESESESESAHTVAGDTERSYRHGRRRHLRQ